MFLLHLAATLYMTGLIWFVQLVHYPLFSKVGPEGFAAYERLHQRWTAWAVMPVMLIEAITAWILIYARPAAIPDWSAWTGLGLLVVVWAVTLLCSVPQHKVLVKGFDERAHNLLVSTNWIRTMGWTLRSALLIWMAARMYQE